MNKPMLDETNCIKPGMELLLTKWIGLSGTAKIAAAKEQELTQRLPVHLIETAKTFQELTSIEQELKIAKAYGTGAVFPVSEGGILSALWSFADASGVGLDIELRSISVRQETIEICEFYRLNPYLLWSEGAVLMADFNAYALARELERAGIRANVIGTANAGNDRILWNEGEKGFLNRPQKDEIARIL